MFRCQSGQRISSDQLFHTLKIPRFGLVDEGELDDGPAEHDPIIGREDDWRGDGLMVQSCAIGAREVAELVPCIGPGDQAVSARGTTISQP